MLDSRRADEADVATLQAQLLMAGTDSAPPTEVRLLPAGTFSTTKGNFTFDAEAAKSVLAKAADWGNEYCFDMGHAMVQPPFGADPAAAERAYGWYKLKVNAAGELVTDGLRWTERGAEMLTKREVRYLSPTFRHDKGRITEFINAGLTNLPATKRAPALVTSRNAHTTEEYSMDPTLLAALGLSKSATEAEVIAALSALKDFRKSVLAFTGKGEEETLKEIATWKERSSEVAALTAKLDKWQAKKAEKKVRKLVSKAIEEGKMPPSLEEKMLEIGRKDVSLLKEYVKSLKGLAALSSEHKEKMTDKEAADVASLSKEDLAVAAALNLDPKEFAKSKAKGVHESEFKPKDADAEAKDKTADAAK